jgi:transposase
LVHPSSEQELIVSASTQYQTYNPGQLRLLPEDMGQWLPEDHLVYFLMDLVDTLDLQEIYNSYYDGSAGGRPPYHPKMLVNLLLYAYCTGMPSSRKIERATYEMVSFRILSGDQHPDHATISGFRKSQLPALARLFVQVLALCRQAGLVKMGHVALDGTKVKANASKHKAMSYGRMQKKTDELEAEVARLLAEAEQIDADEDALYGAGKRGDELPDELRFKQSRLEKIQEAKKALEEEARAQAEAQKAEYEEKERKWQDRGGSGRRPKPPSDQPDPKAQRNFTDPDSRIMPSEGKKNFIQAYNCQAAVDQQAQVIVAHDVVQTTVDKHQAAPMVEQIEANTGRKPKKLSADSGYFTEENAETLQEQEIDAYIATDRQKHGDTPTPCPKGRIPKAATVTDRMTRKLQTVKGRATYALRKEIVEPVFGQIKSARAFDRFSVRGLEPTTHEWALVCTVHNILKLFRSGWQVAQA